MTKSKAPLIEPPGPRRRRTRQGDTDVENADLAEHPTGSQHPLEELQDAIGNQAVLRLLGSRGVQRAPAGVQKRTVEAMRRRVQRKGAAPAAMTEAQARTELQTHWGVQRVDAGTIADQEQHMRNNSMQYFGSPTPPANLSALLGGVGWNAWKPASSSSMWGDLVRAFEDLGKAFGGAPPVQEVLFFKTDYEYDASAPGGPALKASNKELASYGAGSYVIFEAATYQGTLMPLAKGKSVAGAASTAGSRPVGFTLTHELGHGIVEAVLSKVNKDMLKDYQAAVGWFNGRLYDAGVKAVRDAIANQTAPDAQYEITPDKWDDAKWQEQPVSKYSLDGPSEDFPEAVAAYVRDPAMLLARSPRRHAFIANIATTLAQQGSASPLRQRAP